MPGGCIYLEPNITDEEKLKYMKTIKRFSKIQYERQKKERKKERLFTSFNCKNSNALRDF